MKLFKAGLIYDGTGSEPFKGDILVRRTFAQRLVCDKESASEVFRAVHQAGYHIFYHR